MVNLRHLRAFIAVAEELHFTKAAEVVCVSQPALSGLIKQLEDWAEVQLIHRNTRQVELTQAGKEFYLSVRQMLSEFDQASQDLRLFKSIKRGKVSIGALPSLCQSILPKILSSFQSQFPDIRLEVKDIPGTNIMEALHNRDVDLACTYTKREEGVSASVFMRDTLELLCKSDSPLAQKASLSWKELESERIIAMTKGTTVRTLIDGVMASNDVHLNISLEPQIMSSAVSYASAGLGVAILPTSGISPYLGSGLARVKLAEPTIEREISILTLKDYELTPAAEKLREMILQYSPAD